MKFGTSVLVIIIKIFYLIKAFCSNTVIFLYLDMAPLEPGFGDRRGHLENATSERGPPEQPTLSLAS
jgi:hypothetical protein